MDDGFWNIMVNVVSVSGTGGDTQEILQKTVCTQLASSLRFNEVFGELYHLFLLIQFFISYTLLQSKQMSLILFS